MPRSFRRVLTVGFVAGCWPGLVPASAAAATCADYSTQAAAQRAADTRDADRDGTYCESLPCPCLRPGGGGAGSTPARPRPATAPRPKAVSCGKERQTVKTLQDGGAARVSFGPAASTVEKLRLMEPPAVGTHSPRLPGEFTTYRLRVRLRSFKIEDDADIHLVVSSPSDATKTMIVELPNGACAQQAGPKSRTRMAAARSALTRACGQPGDRRFTLLSGTATVTGVAFFDVLHGQRGVAPNGIELHPLISFRSTSRCGAR